MSTDSARYGAGGAREVTASVRSADTYAVADADAGTGSARELQREDFGELFHNLKKELLPATSLAKLKKHFDVPEELSKPEAVLEELGQRGLFRLESVEAIRSVLAPVYARAPWFRALRRYQQRWIPEDRPFALDVLRIVCETERDTERGTERHRQETAKASQRKGIEWNVVLEFLEMDDVDEGDVPKNRRIEASVCNPFSEQPQDEGRLEWYFERFLRHPFVDGVKARNAAASVRTYGDELFKSLFGLLGSDARRMFCAGIEKQTLQRIEVIGPPDFQALHWEALRHPELPDPLATCVPIVRRPKRRESRLGEFQLQMSQSATLNVLLVVARPGGRNDIAYRTLARPLFEDCAAKSELPVRIDLLRPPTFDNLNRFLNDQRARGVRYHIVHLDMHGAVLMWEETVSGVFTNQFAYQQATKAGKATRLICKRFEGKRPLVFFEASAAQTSPGSEHRDGGATEAEVGEGQPMAEAIDAERLGAMLQNYGVPVALIDACQSSKQDAASRTQVDSSLASLLLQKGVRIVVGMAYAVTVDAARTLMCEVYAKMLGKERTTVHKTICLGRKALLSRKERHVFYSQIIELEDWMLPQVYGDADFQLDVQEETHAQKLERMCRLAWAHPLEHVPRYGFFGRDLDVLEIERRILRQATSNVLLVRGMGGVGKTTLLEHLCRWWQQTRLVERVFYFGYDAKAWTRQQILHAVGAKVFTPDEFTGGFLPADENGQQALVAEELRKTRHVMVLDNLESVTLMHLAVPNTLSETEQQLVRRLVQALVGGQTLVLLGSRGAEEWLRKGTFENNVYELGGLDDEAATSFASTVLQKQGIEQPVLRNADVQHVLELLAGFPLPMAVVLSELKRQSPANVRRALEPGGGGPQQGLELAAAGSGRMANKTENIFACVEYSFSNLAHDDQRVLECLAPFIGSFGLKWLGQYNKCLRSQPALACVPLDRFLEALGELKRRGLALDSPRQFLELQPVLPFFLRTRLAEEGREGERKAIDNAFVQLYELVVAGALFALLQSHAIERKALGIDFLETECENLVSAARIGAGMHISVCNCLRTLASYWKTVHEFQRTLKLARMVFEVGGRDTAAREGGEFGYCMLQCLSDEGTALIDLGDAKRAEGVFLRVLELSESLRQANFLEWMNMCGAAYHNLGIAADSQRDWRRADDYFARLWIVLRSVARY